ncbi:hypothetical protein AMTRI_Chr09g42570 [Amborella trichopoda]|uniref:phospholipase D n=1 Tax=Amborella trichopoda TaxID=13333 RepID=U5D1C5_AMBTC|nr:phospholipase D gamma 1 [Amborella trichopoda]ERN19431.1 hypothetical protein AMTR_s00069p00174350 [Amborella trichopoda]|eukprot:XP_006857964.1 phospholipase D gamma 1 [Amborella trichopoda]
MENYNPHSFSDNRPGPDSQSFFSPFPPNSENRPPCPPHPHHGYSPLSNHPYTYSNSLPSHPAYPHSGPLDHIPPPYPYPSTPPYTYSYPSSYYQPPPYPSSYDPPPHLYHEPHVAYNSPQPSFANPPNFQYNSSFNNPHYHFPQESVSGHLIEVTSSPVAPKPSSHVDSFSSSSNSLYPPVEDLVSGIQLSERPSASLYGSHSFNSSQSPRPQGGSFSHPSPGSLSGSSSFNSIPSPNSKPFSHPSLVSPSMDSSQHNQTLQIVPFEPSKGSLKVLLLHGNLDIWILEANNLPNMDTFHKTLGDMFGKRFSSPVASKNEGHMPHQHITSDPYVSVHVSKAVVARTYVISNSENPVWNQHCWVPVAHYAAEVQFVVKDNDVVGSQFIGTVSIPTEQICSGSKVEGLFPILGSNGKPCKAGAVLRLSIQFIPMEKLTIYQFGVGVGPDYCGVPDTYFPLRKGGKVTLYQDAHVPDGFFPGLKLDGGLRYEHGKCWEDVYKAISQARRLIYITGWSVYHKVKLVREQGVNDCDCTLGDLLRSKSQEGVRVLLLVWDDPTSRSLLGIKTDGVMQTHDEETRRFFKHSSVQVLLCPRSAGKRHSFFKQHEVGAIYTHHQKTVIVDADAGNYKRKIIAFVGGLDLCDGRYDTPKHPLFRTLQTVHKEDYHNPTFPAGPDVSGPREPWHDLHSRIDGPAAYDVLTNFQERWLKASKRHGLSKLKRSYDDSLLLLERIPDIVGLDDTSYSNESDPESWHVQIFRSIDSNSVKGFPKDPKFATSKNLACGKNVIIDMSIHTAYVKAIRSAQHFIYIENQYFIGSSYNWSAHSDVGANNLIPMEIALKIASKIKANERFSAYIVIPMWPEGVPTSVPTQRILFWQHKTMQMMYEIIYKALEEMGLEKTYQPQDYLNFFCLGNREIPDGDISVSSPANNPRELAKRSGRFMIYVHSKGMVVDDEYVIIGSANINQRSLDGSRDSEIAMGAYQPQHTWARNLSNPCGQVYGYRLSLWAEHTGLVDKCFSNPESLECVRKIRTLAEMNWKQFASEEKTEIRGHLLKYPVEVLANGKVKALPGCETFPDVGGNILGTFSIIQENLTI